MTEEEKKVEDVPLVPDTPPVTTPSQEPEVGMSWKLKLHMLGTLLFMLVFYVIPLGFTSFIFSTETK